MKKPTVLITGAASGIGRATAIRFAGEGYDVCVNDTQLEKLQSVYSKLPAGRHLLLPGSCAETNTAAEGEKLILDNWGTLNVLINCAALSEETDFIKMETARWRRIFDAMINGSLLMTKLGVKLMSSGGRVIHVTSIHGERAERLAGSYSMAKAAINQFCRSLALELADRNILVNAIAPGFVNTAMSLKNGESELDTSWFRENYIEGNRLPLRRAAAPEEIAGVAFFLAGRDASYITGQVITVDGGLTITF